MRIGLDARTLTSAVRTGVENYVAGLVGALAPLDDIPEIIQVNDTVSLYRWLRNQYMAGYRDTMPTEEEVESLVTEYYK